MVSRESVNHILPRECADMSCSRSDLTRDERRAYISAVHCLHEKPSKTDPAISSGARNRFDDFAVAHILNMYDVHFSPNLLFWHRHFLWEFEQALKNECGYEGGMSPPRCPPHTHSYTTPTNIPLPSPQVNPSGTGPKTPSTPSPTCPSSTAPKPPSPATASPATLPPPTARRSSAPA